MIPEEIVKDSCFAQNVGDITPKTCTFFCENIPDIFSSSLWVPSALFFLKDTVGLNLFLNLNIGIWWLLYLSRESHDVVT